MNINETWLKQNDEYIDIAINWLHLRLQKQAVTFEPVQTKETEKLSWFNKGGAETTSKSIQEKQDKVLADAAKAKAVAEAAEPPPAFIKLSRIFGLTRFESDVLLLCVAMELDGATASLCAKAHNHPHKPYPTFGLAWTLFHEQDWNAFTIDRPLRYWRILEINQPGAEPLLTSALRVDERIVSYIFDPKDNIDDRLKPFIAPIDSVDTEEEALSSSQLLTAETLRHYLAANLANAGQRPLIVQLIGADVLAKQAIASQALSRLGLQIARFPVETLPTQTAELENLTRFWGRERQLLPLALYLDAHGMDTSTAHSGAATLQRLINSTGGVVIIATRDIRAELGGWTLEINKPTSAEQQTAWNAALGSNEKCTGGAFGRTVQPEFPQHSSYRPYRTRRNIRSGQQFATTHLASLPA